MRKKKSDLSLEGLEKIITKKKFKFPIFLDELVTILDLVEEKKRLAFKKRRMEEAYFLEGLQERIENKLHQIYRRIGL